jgi:hypothetical protein
VLPEIDGIQMEECRMKPNKFRIHTLAGVMFMMVSMLLWTETLVSLSWAACVAGPHSGTIAANQEWCAVDNPHLLSDEVTVAPGVILTIEPGAIIQATSIYTGMTIQGDLEAVGTTAQPILFTSQTDTGPEQWRGLGFDGSAAKGYLRNVTVRYGGMYHSLPSGGSKAEVFASNVGSGMLRIEDSLITAAASGNSGYTYGIEVSNSQFLMTGTTISGLGSASDDRAMKISGTSTATVSNNIFTGNPGTTLVVTGGTTTISQNDFYGNWLAMSIGGDNVLVDQNRIYDNGFVYDPKGGISISGGSPTISRNIFRNNTSNDNGAIGIGGSPSLISNVIVGNHATSRCSAIFIGGGAAPVFKHTTISGNDGGDGTAICALGGEFYNTIIANEAIGLNIWNGSVQMFNTLWDNVPLRAAGDGTLQETASITGQAKFDADGYHLTRYSNAIGMGANAGVAIDIDGQERPQPAGTLPDIGADEYIYGQAPTFWIEFYSEDPKLVARENGGVRIEQQFYIFWNYGSEDTDPPDLPLTITSTLPSGVVYSTEQTSGSVGYSFQQGVQTLIWQAQQPVHKDRSGYIGYTVYYSPSIQPGTTVTHTIQVNAGTNQYTQKTLVDIPFFPPKIAYPGSGESCAGLDVVAGYAIPGSRIKLLEDGFEVGLLTPAYADSQGVFSITYNSSKAGINDSTSITVRSCNASDPSQCSPPSNAVTVNRSTSFWCPKSSYWEGDFQTVHGETKNFHQRFQFRDNSGKLATENWLFFPGTGLANSKLSLTMCPCPGSIAYPSAVTVHVNGNDYFAVGDKIKTFNIPAASGAVVFRGICPGGLVENHGTILVDPDGYLFDVTQGFDPNNPTQHSLANATVTLMVEEPELGGWVQWPAHLYNNQVNPQVTVQDGYFAFYTPPGRYYLKVTDKTGYQFWRSPVITVTNKLVHLNVPLTSISNQNIQTVNLTVTGPDKPIVYVPIGGTVEWSAEMIPNITTETRKLHTENPVIRLLSDLDPLTNILGWDGGMMAPGQFFQRRFNQEGEYFYSDGLGNSAMVFVGPLKIYLPLILK